MRDHVAETRTESDSLGIVEMPADQLWGAKIQRSLEHFSIGDDREIITAYAILTSFEIAASSNCKGAMAFSGSAQFRKWMPVVAVAPYPIYSLSWRFQAVLRLGARDH